MFQTLFCERLGCAAVEYEEQALKRFLYLHARLLAPLLRAVMPDFFAHDLKFIRRLALATDMREAAGDLVDFRLVNGDRANVWRAVLRLRVSSRKAGRFARQLFAHEVREGYQAAQ
jgi:hypothetical protein